MRKYGSPYVWKFCCRIKARPPSDEEGFRKWLYNAVRRKWGAGTYRVIRPQAKGERKGFHLVGVFVLDRDHIEVESTRSKRYPTLSKAIPGASWSRQPYFQKEDYQKYGKFRKRGSRF